MSRVIEQDHRFRNALGDILFYKHQTLNLILLDLKGYIRLLNLYLRIN